MSSGYHRRCNYFQLLQRQTNTSTSHLIFIGGQREQARRWCKTSDIVLALVSMIFLSILNHMAEAFMGAGAPCFHNVTFSTLPTTTATVAPYFAFYVLSLQWPFTRCALNPPPLTPICQVPPVTFTIHSLRPALSPSSDPPLCCGRPFHLSAMVDLAPALHHFWPDLSSQANDVAQWHLQWLRYGACSPISQRIYFRRILSLTRQFNFVRAFTALGVNVRGDQNPKFPMVQRVANAAVGGFQVRLLCAHLPPLSTPLLKELQLCFSSDTFAIIDCPIPKLPLDRVSTTPDMCQEATHISIPYHTIQINNSYNSNNRTLPHQPLHHTPALPAGNTLLYFIVAFAVLFALAFCVLYQCRFAVQCTPLLPSTPTYYHPIHTTTSSTQQ